MNELITVSGSDITIAQSVLDDIVHLEKVIKEAEAARDKYKSALLAEMEDKSVFKFENDDISFTYIAETLRESFDSKALKADNPKLWETYIKTTTVKPSVRVKLK